MSREGLEHLKHGSSRSGVLADAHDRLHKFFSSREHLNSMDDIVVSKFSTAFRSLQETSPDVLELSSWVRHMITLASTATIYGRGNPFTDANVEKGFW